MATHNLYTLVYKHLKKKVNAQESDDTLLQLDKVSMVLAWEQADTILPWNAQLQTTTIKLCEF